MLRTVEESIYPQVVNSAKDQEAFQLLPNGVSVSLDLSSQCAQYLCPLSCVVVFGRLNRSFLGGVSPKSLCVKKEGSMEG